MKVISSGFILLFVASVAIATPTTNSRLLLDKLLGPPTPPKFEIEGRIVDGETVTTHDAPYLVSLSITSATYAHTCAGSIIGKQWVVTAAHCLDELKASGGGDIIGVPVYAGLRDRSQLEDAQVTHIDFAFAHKQFTGEQGSDDIALLHVSPPFEFNGRVNQIALPFISEDFKGQDSATYGWGLTDSDAVMYVKDLQVAKATVLNSTECRGKLPEDAPLSHKEICVSVKACYGDGGGPLVAERDGGVSELVGVISWGYLPCGYENRPTVYTAVAQYVDWIAQVQWAYYFLH